LFRSSRARTKASNRSRRVVRDRGRLNAPTEGPGISPRFRLAWLVFVPRSSPRPRQPDEDRHRISHGIEKLLSARKDLSMVEPPPRPPAARVWVNHHRSSQRSAQQPSRLVCVADAGPRSWTGPPCRSHCVAMRCAPRTTPSAATSSIRCTYRPGRLSDVWHRSSGIRRCVARLSPHALRFRRQQAGQQTPLANPLRKGHNVPVTSRLVPESSSETLSHDRAPPSPIRAPSRSAQIASARHLILQYWPIWDTG